MKIQIDKKDLSQGVFRTAGAVEDKAKSSFLLKAQQQEGKLQIFTTNDHIYLYATRPCEVLEEGSIRVPAKFFMDVVRQLPDASLSLSCGDGFLIIESTQGSLDSLHMKIPLKDDSDPWQNPPQAEDAQTTEIPCDKLHYAIDQIQQCVSFESTRAYGTVALMHKPQPGVIRLVGSDGFRLSYAEITCELPEDFLASPICLTKKTLIELQKLCSEGHPSLHLSVADDESVLFAKAPGELLITRLSNTKFPNYQGVLPKGELQPITVPRTRIQHVAKRIMLAADKSHTIQLDFTDQQMTMQSRTVGQSEGIESIELKDYQGSPMSLAINGKYFSDVFSTISSDKILLNIKEEKDPFILRPTEEPENCQSVHVLVPVQQV